MALYTGRGDYGNTNIIGGRTVKKNDVLVEAYGTLDEVNAVVGSAISQLPNELRDELGEELKAIQIYLFDCGSVISDLKHQLDIKVTEGDIKWLESQIDRYEKDTPKIEKFILPGGHQAASALHLARTVTRRAERQIVNLMQEREVDSNVYVFINRLSDYFFAVARYVNHKLNIDEPFYEKTGKVFHED